MRKFIGLISGLLFLSVSYSQPTALVSAIPQKNISSFTDFLKEEAIRERMIHEPGTFNDRVAGPTDSISYTGATTFCSGGNITLTAKYPPTTPGYTYQWTQDGKVINGATSSTYTATTSGVYSVILDDGTTKTQYPSVTVTVNPNPQASFNFNNNNSCSGTTIQFTSNVSGGKAPYAYSWDFGDGQKATTQNPSNQFVSLGCSTTNYSPKLTVIDANGCSNAASQNITVKQAPDVQVKDLNNPFNQFKNCTNSPSANNPNFTVTLGNISPSASCITSYSVDWGDGNTQNGLTSTSFPLSHIYTQLGTFNLNITATSNNGCKNTKTYQVVNQSNPAVGISAPGSTTGCAPSGFWFKLNNYALNSPGTTYTWDFGDNKPKVVWTTQITEDSIFHTFSSNSCTQSNGQFIVQVTASNGCKSTTATVDNITIFQKPVANFNAPVSYCISKAVPFTNTSTEAYNQGSCDRTTNYYWNFGDPGSPQNTSTDESPTHVFSAPGTYTVTLTAEGSCGIDVISKQICIVPNPSSSFTLSNSASCSPLTVTATNTSNTISSCSLPTYAWSVSYAKGACGGTGSWSYTNNTNASSVNPSFIFNDQGTYTITLSVT
ncbi:MAG TPA: PKD domain-containing protein, partial [Flavisolibacter sp.]|nr:PKD domain-containing protein [Flavisolibacter sp.]